MSTKEAKRTFLTSERNFYRIILFLYQKPPTYRKGDSNGANLTELWPERHSHAKSTRPLYRVHLLTMYWPFQNIRTDIIVIYVAKQFLTSRGKKISQSMFYSFEQWSLWHNVPFSFCDPLLRPFFYYFLKNSSFLMTYFQKHTVTMKCSIKRNSGILERKTPLSPVF